MNDKNIEIMDELMQDITQTEEWESIQENDPEIRHADRKLVDILLQIKSIVPRDLYYEIEDAAYSYGNAIGSAAMLYGIHVIEAIRDVSARPCDLSRHIMIRTGRTAE